MDKWGHEYKISNFKILHVLDVFYIMIYKVIQWFVISIHAIEVLMEVLYDLKHTAHQINFNNINSSHHLVFLKYCQS